MFEQKKSKIGKIFLFSIITLIVMSLGITGLFLSNKNIELNFAGKMQTDVLQESENVISEDENEYNLNNNAENDTIQSTNNIGESESNTNLNYGEVVVYSVLLNPLAENEEDRFIICEDPSISYFQTSSTSGSTTYSAVAGQTVEVYSCAQENYSFKGFYSSFDENLLNDYYAYAQLKSEENPDNPIDIEPVYPYSNSIGEFDQNENTQNFSISSEFSNISQVYAVQAVPYATWSAYIQVYEQSAPGQSFTKGSSNYVRVVYNQQDYGLKTYYKLIITNWYTVWALEPFPSGEGYEFYGWVYSSSSFPSSYSSSQSVDSNFTDYISTSMADDRIRWNDNYFSALFKKDNTTKVTLKLGEHVKSFKFFDTYKPTSGIVTVSGTQVEVEINEFFNIYAPQVDDGYEFGYWSVTSNYAWQNGTDRYSEDAYIRASGSGLVITCNAVPKKYTLTLKLDSGVQSFRYYTKSTTISTTKTYSLDYNTDINLDNIICKSGYQFNGWTFSGSYTFFNNSTSMSKDMYCRIWGNLTITCTSKYVAKTISAYAYYKDASHTTPTSGASGGTVQVGSSPAGASSSITVASGNVSLVASPVTNYVFKGWYTSDAFTGDPASTKTTYTINVSANATYYALFVRQYTLTVIKGDDGIASVNPSSATKYDYGANIPSNTVKAILAEGYSFDHWTISSASALSNFNTTTIIQSSVMTLYGDVTVTAYSQKNQYDLNVIAVFNLGNSLDWSGNQTTGGTVQIGNGSSSSASATSKVYYQDQITISAYPAKGYYFAGWFKNVSDQSYSNNYASSGGDVTSVQTESMGIQGLTYYAVFLEYFNVSVQNGVGIVSVDSSALTNGQAYWGQVVPFNVGIESAYEWNTERGATWSVVSGTEPADFEANKLIQNASFTIKNEVTLKVDATIRQYNLYVYAYSTTNGIYANDVIGGSVQINNGEASEFVSEIVDFNQTRTLIANVADGYTFLGWFASFNSSNNTFGELLTTNPNYTTETLQNLPSGNSLSFYAQFVKNYDLTINADDGVLSVSVISGSSTSQISSIGQTATFYFGETIKISALIDDVGYTWNTWSLAEGSTPLTGLNTNTNQEQSVQIGAGNTVLTATTTARPFTLTVHEVYESNSQINHYELDANASNVQEGEIEFGTDLESLVTVPDGFIFEGFYVSFNQDASTGNQFGDKITFTTMQAQNIVVYAKFTRQIYDIDSGEMYAGVNDNSTLIMGNEGGTISVADSLKFGYKTQIVVNPNPGFVLQGIYTTNSTSNINPTTLFIAPSSETDASLQFTCETQEMGVNGLIYYAVFKRQVQTITLNEGEGTSLKITSPLESSNYYFGQTITLDVKLLEGYEHLNIQINKSNDSTTTVPFVLTGDVVSFVVPNFDVTVNAVAKPILYQLTYDSNGGSFSNCYVSNGQAFGAVNYNSDNYSYYFDVDKTNLIAGLPSINRIGYKLLSWNTQPDGNGDDYIIYNENGLEIETKIPYNQTNSLTLYAIWEIVAPIITKNDIDTSFVYDGTEHNIARITVNNFIVDKFYTYTWKNQEGVTIFEETINANTSILKLRSVNQSGIYTCVVSIEDENIASEPTTEVNVEILVKTLTFNIGTKSVVGTLTLDFASVGFTYNGLVAGQSIKSGVLIFAEPTGENNQIIYSETVNKQLIQAFIVVQINASGDIQQDDYNIISNYEIQYEGQITVENRLNYVYLSVGTYERTINPSTFEDIFSSETLDGASFDMAYLVNGENGFKSITSYNGGVQSNYLARENLPNYIDINYTFLPLYFEIYKVEVNGVNVEFTQPNLPDYPNAPIRIQLTEEMLSMNVQGYSLAEIKIFFTVQSLVVYNYNLLDGEIAEGYATTSVEKGIQINGSSFVAPTPAVRNGFQFAGWFYDEQLLSAINSFWTKTGSTTIYAKWNLIMLDGDTEDTDVSIIVKDNNEIIKDFEDAENDFEKIYDAQNYILEFAVKDELYNPIAISYNAQWFKFGIDWELVSEETSLTTIKNVIDSGEYSYSLSYRFVNDNESVESQTVDVGYRNTSVQITINPYTLTADFNIIKTYDATTALPNSSYTINGLGTDSLKLLGYFASPDVNLIDNIPSPIAIIFNEIQPNNVNTLTSNYIIPNLDSITGIIEPYNYEISISASELNKVYDEFAINKEFTNSITWSSSPTSIIHKLTFTIISSSADVGTYKVGDASKFLEILNDYFVVRTSEGMPVSSSNYILTLKSNIRATISPADISIRMVSPEPLIYDGQQHTIYVQTLIGENWVDCRDGILPEGVVSINYTSAGYQTVLFTNAGTYTISASVVTDSNHKLPDEISLSATLVIQKAELEFEFLYDNLLLTDGQQIEYPNIDIASLFSINVKNVSGTVIVPTVTKSFLLNNKPTEYVIYLGTYVINAVYPTENYALSLTSVDKVTFYIVAKAYDVSDIIFENDSMTYEARNLAEDFVNMNLQLQDENGNAFEGLEIGEIIIYNNGFLKSVAQNVGTYQITVKIYSKDPSKWSLTGDSVTATLNITPFVITSLNSVVTAVKTYDGTTTLPTDANIQITVRSDDTNPVIETLKLTGNFVDANVNLENNNPMPVQIPNVRLQDYSYYLASNYVLDSGFVCSGVINPKDVTVLLYKDFVSESINTFIQKPYTQSPATFSLYDAREDGLNLVQGLIDGHVLNGEFITSNSIITKYPYSTEQSMTNKTQLLNNLTVHNANTGEELVNCINNYNIIIKGGIEIVYVLTSVEITGLDDLTYNGLDREFGLILTTKDIINNTEIIRELTYVYDIDGGYFKDSETNENIDLDDLNVEIKNNQIVVNSVKNAGVYEFVITADPSLYIFSETQTNVITLTKEINKAPIIFDLEEVSISYGENLEIIKSFTGQNNEIFNLRFYYETNLLDAGIYDLSNSQIFTWDYKTNYDYAINPESTANLDNYQPTISGTLNISPLKITVSFDFPKLVYNGTNRLNELNSIYPKFNDGTLSLVENEQFWRTYLFEGSQTTEIKNVGNYTLILSSKNYSFVDGTSNEEYNIIEFNFEITKQDLLISLMEDGDLIKKQFNNQPQNFELNSTNQLFVTGTVNGEMIVATFTTLGADVGRYVFADDTSNGITYAKIEVREANGLSVIQNGENNYNITFEGGIEIVYVSTVVEFDVKGDTYTGSNIQIDVILTTDARFIGGDITRKTLSYSYSDNKLLDGITQISTEDLQLIINYSSDALGSIENTIIKNAGEYTFVLNSNNYTYTLGSMINDEFVPANNNSLTSEIFTVSPKNIILTLGEPSSPGVINITYKDELSHSQIFDTTVTGTGEIFNLIFVNSETKNLNVGEYDIADYITMANIQHNPDGTHSTAEFYNYNITIEGTLVVNPRQVSVESSFENLVYNGKDRLNEIKNKALLLSFEYQSTILKLTEGVDYNISYFAILDGVDTSINDINLIKNAGQYKVVISSANYSFFNGEFDSIEQINTISLEFQILKAELYILLFDDNNLPQEEKILIEKPYVAQVVNFEINALNYIDYTSGVVENEYLTAIFTTTGSELGEYLYTDKKLTLQNGLQGIKIFDINGNETTSNYNIMEKNSLVTNISGGIKIVENKVETTFNNLQNLTYDNQNKEFSITLTKTVLIDGMYATIIYELIYDNNTKQLIVDDEELRGIFTLEIYFNKDEAIFNPEHLLSNNEAIVKNAGFYKLVLISSSEEWLFGSSGVDDNKSSYTFQVKKYNITDLDLGNQQIDYSNVFATNKQVEYFKEIFTLNIIWTETSTFDVGNYSFANMPLEKCNFDNNTFANNYEVTGFVGTLIIQPKAIDVKLYFNNQEYNIESNAPVYSGQDTNFITNLSFKFYDNDSELNLNNNFENNFKFNNNIVTSITNAGEYTANLSSINYKFINGNDALNVGEVNTITLSFEVLKTDLKINLIENSDNIKKQFNNKVATFEISASDLEQQNKYIDGTVNGETISVSFETNGTIVGTYNVFPNQNLGEESPNINVLNLIVYQSNATTEIINGYNNYNIIFNGGIDIVYITSNVEFKFLNVDGNPLNLDNLYYIGQDYQFEIEITTDYSLIGGESNKTVVLVYDNLTSSFKNKITDEILSIEDLRIDITYGDASEITPTIKNAGQYQLTLISSNFMFLFEESLTGNSLSQTLEIKKTIFQFDIKQEISFGDALKFTQIFKKSFDLYEGGSVSESFNLIFENASTTTLNAGIYTNTTNPKVALIYSNYKNNEDGAISTALFNNYDITISDSSTLTVNPRQLSVDTTVLDELNLVYNGQDRLLEISNLVKQFKFKFGEQDWELTTGTGTDDDYSVEYYSVDKTNGEENLISGDNLIKNAGTYIIKLISNNYKFSGDNVSNSVVSGNSNWIKFEFDISKANLTVNLTENDEFVKTAFRNQPVIFSIDKSNQEKFVTFNPVTNEYIEISFITSGADEGLYEYGGLDNNIVVEGNIKIKNASNDEILEEIDFITNTTLTNYNYTISGGIEIVKNLTTVTYTNLKTNLPITDLSQEIYSGQITNFKITLTWEDVDGSSKRADYKYDTLTRQLVDFNTLIPVDAKFLRLAISYISANSDHETTSALPVPVNEIKNAGTYKLLLISENNSYTFVNGETYGNTHELTYIITPFEVVVDLGQQNITYADKFYYIYPDAVDGVNNEKLSLIFSYTTENFNAGSYEFSSQDDFPDGILCSLNPETSTGSLTNYTFNIIGLLTINPLEININNFAISDKTYDANDWIARLNEVDSLEYSTDIDGESVVTYITKGEDYQVEFYKDTTLVNQIINAGVYKVKILSQNYKFIGGTSSNSINSITFEFKILQKELTVKYNGLSSNNDYQLVYNATEQNPLFENYTILGIFDADLSTTNTSYSYYSIDNSQGLEQVGVLVGTTIKNANNYFAVLTVDNPNYKIAESDEKIKVIISPYTITADDLLPLISAGMFSKYYGAEDPNLVVELEIFENSGEFIKVLFSREEGENIGFYKLITPISIDVSNSDIIKQNYQITIESVQTFEDKTTGGFEVKKYDGVLIIKQKNDITLTYNSQQYNEIDFVDYMVNFDVVDINDNILPINQYKIENAIFKFILNGVEQSHIKNVGFYSLKLDETSASTSTHSGIQFENNDYNFIIEPKTLQIDTTGVEISRQYDGTTSAPIDGILSLTGVENSDINKVSLKGIFVNERQQEQRNVGEYYIKLQLSAGVDGDETSNYILDLSSIFTGKITPCEIVIKNQAIEDFNKIYDRNSTFLSYNIMKLSIETVDGSKVFEDVGLSGMYCKNIDGEYVPTVDVSGNLIIRFNTSNTNFKVVLIDGQEYLGAITPKSISLDKSSVLTKIFDNTTSLDISKLSLNANDIFDEDKNYVEIASANFAGSSVGTHEIRIILKGEKANNYVVKSVLGTITEQIITLKFNYGDEIGVYEFAFVDDAQTINKGLDNLSVFFNTKVSDSSNGSVKLPIPTRTGYDFAGWFVNSSYTESFTDNTLLGSSQATSLETLKANNYVLNLYANWNIQSYELNIEVQTESSSSNAYEVSVVGGTYVMNGEKIEQTNKTFILEYYSSIEFTFDANEHYTFSGIFNIRDELLNIQNPYTIEHLTENQNFVFKFDVERLTIKLNINTLYQDEKVTGFENTIWQVDETNSYEYHASIKYNQEFDLVSKLNRLGYEFLGWASTLENANNGLVEFSSEKNNLNQIATMNTTFYAVWEVISYKIYLDFNEGILDEDENYDEIQTDLNGQFIYVNYNSQFDNLPKLIKRGFVLSDWTLKQGNNILILNVNNGTTFKFENNSQINETQPFILLANWSEGENIVSVVYGLDTSKYEENNLSYSEYENGLSMYFVVGNGQQQNYQNEEEIVIETNQFIKFIPQLNNDYYEFLGWYVDGQPLENNKNTIIDGVVYQISNWQLTINKILWGSDKPNIELKYQPKTVEIIVNSYNNNFGSVELISGIYTDSQSNKTYTLTGTSVQLLYIVKTGYELKDSLQNSITGVENIVETTVESGQIVKLDNFNDKQILIDIQFIEKAYPININIIGENAGIEELTYKIDSGDYQILEIVDSNASFDVRTGNVIEFKLTILYGYENVKDWTINGSNISDIRREKTNSYIENDKQIVVYKISNFTQSFDINIDISKQLFDVVANIVHLVNGNYAIQSTSENVVNINLNNDNVNKAPYNSEVNFVATPFVDTLNIDGKDININKYIFVGWHERIDKNGYITWNLISEQENYPLTVTGNKTLYAVFELEKFDINYSLNIENSGSIVSAQGNAITKQTVSYGNEFPNEIFARLNSGYVLDKWEINYLYEDADLTSSTKTFESVNSLKPENIGVVCSNIEITLFVKTVDVKINLNAVFDEDFVENLEDKISIQYEQQNEIFIEINTQTTQILNIKAEAKQQGYVFKEWIYKKADGSYAVSGVDYELISSSQILINQANKTKVVGSNLQIKFVNTSEFLEYEIYACFERDIHEVRALLYIEEENLAGNEIGGQFKAQNSGGLESVTSFKMNSKTEDTFSLQFLVLAGYYFDLDVEKPFEIVTEGGEQVQVNFTKLSLDEIDVGYETKWELTIENITRDTTIYIYLQREETTLYFYNRTFTSTGSVGEYVETPIVGTVKFGTSVINLDDNSILVPTQLSYDFKGWSISRDYINLIIDTSGKIVGEIWKMYDKEMNLYAVWEIKKVQLNVKISPQSALINLDYYPELFNNIYNNAPLYSSDENAYYFVIGSIFGISSPKVYDKYKLLEYKVLLKNTATNSFEWQTITVVSGVTEYSKTLFEIDNFNNFVYSTATNYNQLGNVEDGTIYIELVYGLEIVIENANLYSTNRVSVIGGEAKFDGVYSSGIFKINTESELSKQTVVAIPANGYKLDHWVISGEIVYPNSNSLVVEIDENLSIKAVFVGEEIQVVCIDGEHGIANEITGGNLAEKNGVKVYHVGDILTLSATPNVGYNFNNSWTHPTSGTFTSNTYTIVYTDLTLGTVNLKPLFEEKIVDVSFQIEGSKGVVLANTGLSTSVNNGIVTYKYRIKYFSDIEVTLQPNERYFLESLILDLGEKQVDLSNNVNNNVFKLTPDNYENSNELVFKVNFEERYWIDYVVEKGYVSIDNETNTITVIRDLSGTGTQSDPYKINNIDDYALWAFVINNGVNVGSVNKLPYNSSSTYYEVTAEVMFNSRFWTPIGTKDNPFNGQVSLYENRIGIVVDYDDIRYPENVFDSETINEWKGLFGYLGENANIYEQNRDFTLTYIIIGAISLFLIILIVIIIIIYKRRKRIIDSLDEKNVFKDIDNNIQ